MREMVVHVAQVMAVWIALSVGATAMLARIFKRLHRSSEAPSYDRALAADQDIVEATGGVYEGRATRLANPASGWPDESLDILWTAANDPAFVDSVLDDIAMLDTASLSDEISDSDCSDGKETK